MSQKSMSGVHFRSNTSLPAHRPSRVDLNDHESVTVPPQRAYSPRSPILRDGFEASKPAKPLSALRRGMTGPDVKELKLKLFSLKLLSTEDMKTGRSVYGPRTERGVRRFQERMGASLGAVVQGIADPRTRAAIMKAQRKDFEEIQVAHATKTFDPSKTVTDEDDPDGEPTNSTRALR